MKVGPNRGLKDRHMGQGIYNAKNLVSLYTTIQLCIILPLFDHYGVITSICFDSSELGFKQHILIVFANS